MWRRFWAVTNLLFCVALGCDARPRGTGGAAPQGATQASSKATKKTAPLATTSVAEATRVEPEATEPKPALPYGELSSRWTLDTVQDLAPAGPMTASANGIVFVTLDDRVLVAHRKDREFQTLDADAATFARYGRGPALTRTHAYWIAPRGELRRGALNQTLSEKVAGGARSGTRVSAQSAAGRDVVAYVAGPDDHPRAYVWAEGNEPLALSEDASTASSVGLLEGHPHPRAIVLEGGWGLSPVHQREVRVTKRHLNLTPDEVAWVAPGAQPLTELVATGLGNGGAAVFVAVSRDMTHFGLADLSLGVSGAIEGEPSWRLYPNGIDPAPVATARACGADYVFFVVPTESQPRSPQELRVGRRDSTGALVEEEILVRSKAFNDVSAAAAAGGVVLSWTADRRTWGAFAACP